MDVKLGESQQNNGSLSLSLTTCGSSSAGHDMVVNFSFRVDLPAQAQATVGLWSIDASGHQGDRVTGAAWWPSALVAMLQDGRWHCVKVQIVARDHFSVHLDTRQLITARLTNGSAHSGLQVKQGIVNCGKDTEHQCMNELKVETKLLSLSVDDVKVQSTNQRQDQNGYVIQADSGRKINQATARSSWSEKFHRVLEHWLFAIIYYSFAFVPITCYFTWLYKCYMQPQLEDERNDGVEEEEVSGDEDAEDEDDAKKEK
ncbi:hypothetical protein HDE_07024 [Halotydeus destructor]|nr:hypothetical protein HDE_07024 [Halotydeus destructor]